MKFWISKFKKFEISENWTNVLWFFFFLLHHPSIVLLLLLNPSSVLIFFLFIAILHQPSLGLLFLLTPSSVLFFCSLSYYIILMDPFTNRRIYDSADENWKENRKSLCMILWMFGRIQTKILANHLNLRLTKYTQKKRKEAATIVVEISKNFSKGISYVSWIFENCYHVSDNKFNTQVLSVI